MTFFALNCYRDLVYDGVQTNTWHYFLDLVQTFPNMVRVKWTPTWNMDKNVERSTYARSGFALYQGRQNSAYHE